MRVCGYRDKQGQWLLILQSLRSSEEYRQVNPPVPCKVITAMKDRREAQGVMHPENFQNTLPRLWGLERDPSRK